MPNEELDGPIDSAASNPGHDALTMAFAVILDRMQRLNPSDRDELFALVKVLPRAEPREMEWCVVAMREILEQGRSPTRRLDCRSEPNSPRSFRSPWTSFVSKQIARERAAAGLTQSKLAKKAGMLQGHISKLESGRHKPSYLTMFKIAKALDKPLSVFDL
jgi:DNA-binding XRE family transcriptional regulator